MVFPNNSLVSFCFQSHEIYSSCLEIEIHSENKTLFPSRHHTTLEPYTIKSQEEMFIAQRRLILIIKMKQVGRSVF